MKNIKFKFCKCLFQLIYFSRPEIEPLASRIFKNIELFPIVAIVVIFLASRKIIQIVVKGFHLDFGLKNFPFVLFDFVDYSYINHLAAPLNNSTFLQ